MTGKLIGVEMEGQSLVAVKARKGWKRSFVEGFYFADLPADPEDSEMWEEARASFRKWAGDWLESTPIVASLPGDEAIPVRLQFPFRQFSKIVQVLKAEIEGHVPLTVDDSVVDFIPVDGKGGEGLEVIAVAAAKKTLGRQLESLAALDIVPTFVTYSPIAVFRAILALTPSLKDHVFGIIHLGAKYVSFSLCESGRLSFIRTFRINGGLDFAENGGDSESSLNRESLLQDLRFTLRACSPFLDQENPIDQLVLSGGKADLGSLAAQVESELGISCRPVDWGDGLHAPGGDIPSPENLARSTCALGGALSHPKPFEKAFDLRREEFSRPQGWRELRRPIIAAAAAAALALGIGIADLSIKVRHAERRLQTAQSNVETVLREVFPSGERVVSPAPQITSRLRKKARRLKILMGNPAMGESALALVARISAAVPSSLKMRLNQLAIDEGGISLKGVTLNFEAVDRIKNLLSQKGGFEKPEVKQARLLSNKRGVEFFLHIPMNEKRDS